jgi:hypothetical protein
MLLLIFLVKGMMMYIYLEAELEAGDKFNVVNTNGPVAQLVRADDS